jgi:DNA polymerase III alpha subunit
MDLARAAGIKNPKAAWEMIVSFSAYSFNRAHSMEYAHRGYYMAWLKINHPLEFHTSMLETISMAGDDYKEKLYVREARRRGIKLLPADVNISGAYWTIDNQMQAVRRGLASIKGVGGTTANAIQEGQPYSGMRDFIDRTDARAVSGGKKYLKEGVWSGRLKDLREAGALDSLLKTKSWET